MYCTRKSLFSLASTSGLMLLGAVAHAAFYVNVNTGLDTNPGSPTKPLKTIQKAINLGANTSIVVAAGTYHESLTWSNKNLNIVGAGEGASIIDPSVAGGGPGGRCLYTNSLGNSGSGFTSQISGFTFQNGSAADFGGGMYNVSCHALTVTNCTFTNNAAKQGGGMYNASSNLTLTTCTFTQNTVTNNDSGTFNGGGGGMFNADSSPTLTDCTFSNNIANGYSTIGGGMVNQKSNTYLPSSNPTLTNCTFSNNWASVGGGGMSNQSSTPTVMSCQFLYNTAGSVSSLNDAFGGGMINVGSSPTVTSCTFSANWAKQGGGVCNFNSSPSMTNCTFTNNQANGSGGGMFNTGTPGLPVTHLTVTNCIFTNNWAVNNGGGMYNTFSGPIVTNCTFALNVAGSTLGGGGGMYNQSSGSTVTNCIIWGNTWGLTGKVGDVPANGGIYGTATITYSDVQGLSTKLPDSKGNFAADPLFVDAVNGNFRLMFGSLCRDHGNNAVVKSPPFLFVNGYCIDLDGSPRLVDSKFGIGGRVDMGAYEWH